MPLRLGDEAKLDERQQHASRYRTVDACAFRHIGKTERRTRSIECLDALDRHPHSRARHPAGRPSGAPPPIPRKIFLLASGILRREMPVPHGHADLIQGGRLGLRRPYPERRASNRAENICFIGTSLC